MQTDTAIRRALRDWLRHSFEALKAEGHGFVGMTTTYRKPLRYWWTSLPHKWSHVSSLMHSGVRRYIAAVPTLGSVLLWSGSFRDTDAALKAALLKLNINIETAGTFIPGHLKLQLLYFGAVLLLAAFAIYWFRCPHPIRAHPSIDAYLTFQASRSDRYARREAQLTCETILDRRGEQSEYKPNAPASIVDHKFFQPASMLGSAINGTNAEMSMILFRAEYLVLEQRNPVAFIIAASLATLGLTLSILPALDVFAVVTWRLLFH